MRLFEAILAVFAVAFTVSASAQVVVEAPPAIAARATFRLGELHGELGNTNFQMELRNVTIRSGFLSNESSADGDWASAIEIYSNNSPLPAGRYQVGFVVRRSNVAWSEAVVVTNGVSTPCALVAQPQYNGAQICSGAVVATAPGGSLGASLQMSSRGQAYPPSEGIEVTFGDITVTRFENPPGVDDPRTRVPQPRVRSTRP